MALFKILKGVEKKDSSGKSVMLNPSATNGAPEIHEGWAYVTTDEGNMYVDVTDKKRVKIGAKSDLALQAINDNKGQNIAETYLAGIALTEDDASPIYVVARGDNTTFNLKIPVADTNYAGVITAGDQAINGKKTMHGRLVILGDAADKKLMTRGIVGSDGDGNEGDLYLQYSNSASDSIYLGASGTHKIYSNGAQYTGNAATATKAVNDDKNQNIAQTYVKGLTYVYKNKSIPELKFVFGDNNEDYVAVPVATNTNGGIVTTAAQTFGGAKTFNGAIIAKSTIAADENISTKKQFVSSIAKGTAPFVVTSNTVVTNLNADFVDGKSASNDTFTAGGASSDIVPTQRAIMNSLNDLLMASQALVYRGLIDPTDKTTYPPTPVTSGSVYVISKEGTFDKQYCEPGDIVIGYYDAATQKSMWDIVQNNINGAVVIKDGGSVNRKDITLNAIPRFDTVNGRVIKNSKITIDDNGTLLPTKNNTQAIGASTNVWANIYATNFVGLSTNATYDDVEAVGGNPIKKKYIAGIQLVNHASAPYYQAYDGTNSPHSTFNLPVASASDAGVITTGAQTITGNKTIDGNGSLTINKLGGFNYVGIQEGTTGTARSVWFSHTSVPGTPCIHAPFTYNPASNTKWTNYDANTPTYGELKADRFSGLASHALYDDMGGTIKKKYFAAVALTNHASAPYYTFYDGTNTAFSPTLPLPVASTTNAGIVTTIAQTFTGNKTFDANSIVTINATSGLIFAGIEPGSSGVYRPVWFGYSSRVSTPVYNENFQYNPSSTEKWTNYDGTKVTAYGSLKCARFQGISFKALNDDMGGTIKKKYIAGITLTNHASAPYYTLFDGTNTAFSPTLAIPVANTEQAGVVTKIAQSFAGKKTFTGGVEFTVADFNYSGIEHATANASRSVWFADSARVGKPCYNNSFLYNPAEQRLYITNVTGTITNAIGDESGQNIMGTYLAGAALDTKKFVFTFTLGNNNILTTLSPNFAASASCGGSALVANLLDSFDTRSATRSPQDTPKGISANFKSNATAGLNDGGSYVGVMSWRSYGNNQDLTGGYPMEFAYTANKNLYLRFGTSATAWSTWDRVLTDANFSTKSDSVFGGSSNRAKYLETWYSDKSKTYDQAYPLYAWWRTGDICKLTVDNYKTEVDRALLADVATISRSLGTDDSLKLYAQFSNEINFGGANTGTDIYIGYRATDSRPIPTNFIFGGSGSATITAARFTGTADTAVALTTNAGNAGQPIYFTGGKPAAIDWHVGNSGLGEHNCNNVSYNFCGYYTSNGPATSIGATTNDGSLWAQAYNSTWVTQIAQDYRNGGLFVRGKNNGTWTAWDRVLTVGNFTGSLDGRYVKKTGDTMTGTLRLNPPYHSAANSRYSNSAIEIREAGLVTTNQSAIGYAPRIGFHWGGRVAASLALHSDGAFYFRNQADSGQANVYANIFYGSLSGNATTSTSSGYLTKKASYTTIAEVDAFLEDNKVQWATVTAAGTALNNDGVVMSYGWSNAYGAQMYLDDGSGAACCYIRNRTGGSAWNPWRRLWASGDAVTGAVWNDYAECRESDTQEAGYVLSETGEDSLVKTTERLQHFAGVSSDTWGFSQGETEKAKTHIAVAGRVLVYPYQDRNNYKPGDCVCAAPGGTVDIMTREEVVMYPDRIVGTVSCVPEYDTWGGGEMADRDPVKVNGRIWIKVR